MLSIGEITIRLVVAALLGSLVGLERERHDWVAGLRTHMMVCVGSTVAMIVSSYGFFEVLNSDTIVLDPSRVAAQVISGIGFLGAGTIIYLRHNVVRGLTTAAGLWTVAAIGLAIGGGMYWTGIIATVLAVIILAVMKPLEKLIISRKKNKTFSITIDRKSSSFDQIDKAFVDQDLKVVKLEIHQSSKTDENLMVVTLGKSLPNTAWPSLVEALNKLDGVKEISIRGEDLFR